MIGSMASVSFDDLLLTKSSRLVHVILPYYNRTREYIFHLILVLVVSSIASLTMLRSLTA